MSANSNQTVHRTGITIPATVVTPWVLSLKCAVQTYEWGKIGSQSEVAQLLKNANGDFHLNETQPYAELWMGTHPNGPSTILNEEFFPVTLGDWIQGNKKCLGDKVIEKFGFELPFLFKVLSVNKALSIQAHPNKTHAELLNSLRPDLYKDPNHKPELAIALTPFEALCGFRTLDIISNFLKDIPELMSIVGDTNAKNLELGIKGSLKSCFQALMTCSEDIVKTKLASLAEKLSNQEKRDDDDNLFLRIYQQYPGDVGCFGIYFFNYIQLNPGEALYLGPNEPHAYLLGDCIECMACSDNVVRAGLTPKFKDVQTLCDMLTYSTSSPEQRLFKGTRFDDFSDAYAPPVPDFAVIQTQIPDGINKYELAKLDSASIVICVSGNGIAHSTSGDVNIRKGSVLFISSGLNVKVTIQAGGMLLFRAYANV